MCDIRMEPASSGKPTGRLALYKENPVLDTGFVEAMRLNNNFPTVKLKLRSGNCNKV